MQKTYESEKVVLVPLTSDDAEQFYGIYNQPDFWEAGINSAFQDQETPESFTSRIISLCEMIFTIRAGDNPQRVIGDCALHHLNQKYGTVEIGGTLLKDYRGMGYMNQAFQLLLDIASKELGVKTVIGKTTPANTNAIRLAEKLGFRRANDHPHATILKRSF